ncbi:thioredoxin domain-containing protein [Salidesulfovibrio onnuriiensis]|uniref:thioredoxin domain-containing protein n=1 Tax=Salidesulfovibrio onnuriiensis TaxID=2583823 RepID=UPI0011C71294|nr:thioredoxin domain-containing protein [Salidesulfovibrio onnuriiensis]
MQLTNALANEKSPYLLQHAHNPVQWRPWSEQAFELAKLEDKPVLVSIGYSTCHWCHVMERESFENEDIARLLNDTFICIKVDREERPDIDAVYMNVCQLLTGSGGWPLNVVVTPDRQPFFASTYIPPESRFGRLGLTELTNRVSELWRNERKNVQESAESITLALRNMETPAGDSDRINAREITQQACASLAEAFDDTHGGFGQAPKFPSAHSLLFLLGHANRQDDQNAEDMTLQTLRAMRAGGIWDHIGFGFHRYSTDKRWLLPHFEKMLYDQSMLALAYLEAWQQTKSDEFADTARRILGYVLRDMRDAGGAFYMAEDADSEGEEGLFYTWTMSELQDHLSPVETELFCGHYNIKPKGNFHDEATGRLTGRNIPHETPGSNAPAGLASIRKKLYTQRETRIRPHLDDKILTDMNGLMIAALARGGRTLGHGEFTDAALNATNFILEKLHRNGTLRHGYRQGLLRAPGMLDDYAFLIWGLLELHTATDDTAHLETAESIARTMLEEFEDREHGGFFLAPASGETVLVRTKPGHDGAIPCGNSVAVHVLARLGRLLDRADFLRAAQRCVAWASKTLGTAPHSLLHMVAALEDLYPDE